MVRWPRSKLDRTICWISDLRKVLMWFVEGEQFALFAQFAQCAVWQWRNQHERQAAVGWIIFFGEYLFIDDWIFLSMNHAILNNMLLTKIITTCNSFEIQQVVNLCFSMRIIWVAYQEVFYYKKIKLDRGYGENQTNSHFLWQSHAINHASEFSACTTCQNTDWLVQVSECPWE
jgi:hypothetical protein